MFNYIFLLILVIVSHSLARGSPLTNNALFFRLKTVYFNLCIKSPTVSCVHKASELNGYSYFDDKSRICYSDVLKRFRRSRTNENEYRKYHISSKTNNASEYSSGFDTLNLKSYAQYFKAHPMLFFNRQMRMKPHEILQRENLNILDHSNFVLNAQYFTQWPKEANLIFDEQNYRTVYTPLSQDWLLRANSSPTETTAGKIEVFESNKKGKLIKAWIVKKNSWCDSNTNIRFVHGVYKVSIDKKNGFPKNRREDVQLNIEFDFLKRSMKEFAPPEASRIFDVSNGLVAENSMKEIQIDAKYSKTYLDSYFNTPVIPGLPLDVVAGMLILKLSESVNENAACEQDINSFFKKTKRILLKKWTSEFKKLHESAQISQFDVHMGNVLVILNGAEANLFEKIVRTSLYTITGNVTTRANNLNFTSVLKIFMSHRYRLIDFEFSKDLEKLDSNSKQHWKDWDMSRMRGAVDGLVRNGKELFTSARSCVSGDRGFYRDVDIVDFEFKYSD